MPNALIAGLMALAVVTAPTPSSPPPEPAAPTAKHVGQPPPPPKPGPAVAPDMPKLQPGGVKGAHTPGGSGGAATPSGGSVVRGSSSVTSTAGATTVRSSRGDLVRGQSGRTRPTTAATTPIQVLDTWELWWLHNRDEFLDLRSRRPAADTTVSGSPGHLLGRGRRVSTSGGHRPSQERLDREVVPALLELLRTHTERELLNSAALAVGRVASPDVAPEVLERLADLLDHDERQVQASAVLGLGALASSAADDELTAVLRDDSLGRRLTGGAAVDRLPRALAALSLGLLGDARGAWTLLDVVRRLPDKERDVKACSLAALGLLPADSPRTAVARTLLADMLEDPGLDPYVASVIPTTLAKLEAREELPRLLDVFRDRDTDRLVRQSLAIAFGRLADLDDAAVVAALLDEVQDGRDASTRQFALIALGRMGAAGSADAEAHRTLRLHLQREFMGRGRKAQRTWAALAAALHARAHEPSRNAMLPELRKAYADENDPNARAAYALALGLAQDTSVTETLRVDLRAGDEVLSGFSAVALGLLEDRESAPGLRMLLQRNGSSPAQRRRIATALALLADIEAVPDLIELLASGVTYEEQAAFTHAIGLIGDERALEPLLQIASDDSFSLHERGFACVALGMLGERTEHPFQTALRADTNYLTRLEPLVVVAELP